MNLFDYKLAGSSYKGEERSRPFPPTDVTLRYIISSPVGYDIKSLAPPGIPRNKSYTNHTASDSILAQQDDQVPNANSLT